MAVPISKFGQYVLLQVHNSEGALVFQTDSLKIDFDIRHIKGWSRAKFTLTNLAPDTIKKISSPDSENYVTLYTRLHDGELSLIADRMFVSNALETVNVPESIFSIFCYSKLRKAYLEQQIDVKVPKTTLIGTIDAVVKESGFAGTVEYKHFPDEILSFVPPKPRSRQRGSLISVLENLGEEYSFNTYTIGNKFVFMYKPSSKNVQQTQLFNGAGEIKLSTSNMRDNPKIGPATLGVVSNLDSRIIPTTVLDISNLLTVGTDTNEETLQVAENYLREKVAGFGKYQTLSVQHRGSNWTSLWKTVVAATSPTPGISMSTENWWT